MLLRLIILILIFAFIPSCKSHLITINGQEVDRIKYLEIDCTDSYRPLTFDKGHDKKFDYKISLVRGITFIIESEIYDKVSDLNNDQELLKAIYGASHSGEFLLIEVINSNDENDVHYYSKVILLKNCD